MKNLERPLFLTIFVILLIAIAFLQAAPASLPLLHPAEHVLRVDLPTGYGSCTPIKSVEGKTWVLTAKHVAEAAPIADLFQVLYLGEEIRALRIVENPDLDVALVLVDGMLPALPMDEDPPFLGERLQSAGWDFGQWFNLSEGLVSGMDHMTTDSFPGSSGGAVLRNGQITGVIHSNFQITGTVVGGQTFFTPISEISDWIRATIK